MDTALKVLMYASIVIGSASMLAATLAPLTKTDLDDKAVGVLSKIKKVLDAIALNLK